MAWPASTVNSWEQFVNRAAVLVSGAYPTPYMFRGQAAARWSLKPSLLRLLPADTTPDTALAVEKSLLENFRSEVHLHIPAGHLPQGFPAAPSPEWWALMQHHGAPTRLLDWSMSPYVGAYFAVESDWDQHGAIFIVHAHAAQKSYVEHFGAEGKIKNETFLDPSAPTALLFWYPSRKSARFVAQQGFTSLGTNVLSTHDDLIGPACQKTAEEQPGKLFHHKWIIPMALKPAFLRNLRAMNIAAHSLFPGLDGTCRSATEAARLALTSCERSGR